MKRKFLVSTLLIIAFIVALTINFRNSENKSSLAIENIEVIKANASLRGGGPVMCVHAPGRCEFEGEFFFGYEVYALQ
jgi:hypothetical protein